MNRKYLLLTMLLFMPSASAVCPLCTVAVGAGVGILRYFGIDDLITGVWLGGLILSSSLWLDDWLGKKKINFKYKNFLLIISFYILFILPLYIFHVIDNTNSILGINRLILGIVIGTIVFASSILSDSYLRKINDNKAVFPYQKVIIPVVYLIIISVIIFLILGII